MIEVLQNRFMNIRILENQRYGVGVDDKYLFLTAGGYM